MAGRLDTPPILDPEHAAFIQGRVSIVVAGRNADLVPEVARGCACRVSADRRRVTVLVDAARSQPLLAAVESNGLVAVVVSQPSTHRTIQLKGTDARVARATVADRKASESNLTAWVEELASIGFDRELARSIRGAEIAEMVAVTFTATSAFRQTPGPGAGERLGT